MRFSCVLVVLLCLTSFLMIVPEADAASPLEDPVIVHSYKSERSMKLVIEESTKSAYQNVEVFTFYSGTVRIYSGDSLLQEYQSDFTGTVHHLNFNEGDEPDLRIELGSLVYDYQFKIRKSIPLSELDEEIEEIISLPESQFYLQVVLYCLISFVIGVVGVFTMYLHFKKKAAEEVRSLV